MRVSSDTTCVKLVYAINKQRHYSCHGHADGLITAYVLLYIELSLAPNQAYFNEELAEDQCA